MRRRRTGNNRNRPLRTVKGVKPYICLNEAGKLRKWFKSEAEAVRYVAVYGGTYQQLESMAELTKY